MHLGRAAAGEVLVLVGLEIVAPAHAPPAPLTHDDLVAVVPGAGRLAYDDVFAPGTGDAPVMSLCGPQNAAAAGVEGVAHLVDQFVVDDAARVGLVEAADRARIDAWRPMYLGNAFLVHHVSCGRD